MFVGGVLRSVSPCTPAPPFDSVHDFALSKEDCCMVRSSSLVLTSSEVRASAPLAVSGFEGNTEIP